ncbi:helicase-related protein [Pseudomonas sp. DSV-1]|nr:helicase-related protein [Pseudomonas sp. DSV-1]MEC4242128.1 helicase-related protein [Pseudomonas sp. DSV-1]
MSQTMKWLDFKSYGMKLVLGRDRSPKKNHTLLFAGPGLQDQQTLAILTELGFSRDLRFPNKQYWTRSHTGFRLTDLRSSFPNCSVVDLPVEEISPAAKFDIKQRQETGVKHETNTEPRSRPTGITARNTARGLNDGGAGANGVLVKDAPQPDVRKQSSDDVVPTPVGDVDQLSERTGGDSDRQSPAAGEGVPETESTQSRSNASGTSSVEQPGEVVRGGDSAEQSEPADTDAARGTSGKSEALTQPNEAEAIKAALPAAESSEPLLAPESEPIQIPEARTSEGFSQLEYDAVSENYGTGVSGASDLENPFDQDIAAPVLELSDEPQVQKSQDLESDDYWDTREAFNRREYDTAYALYQTGMNGNGVDREAFEHALAGMSGGRAASLYLTQDQRRELHHMGMRDNIVEHFATHYAGEEANLAHAFNFASQNDSVLAASITRRMTGDEGLGGLLTSSGFEFVADEEPSTGAPEYLYRSPFGESVVIGVGNGGLHITGHGKGQVLPIFEVRDTLSTPIAFVGMQLLEEVAAIWPHLITGRNPETVATAKSSESQAQEQAPAKVASDAVEPIPAIEPAKSALDDQLQSLKSVVATAESQPSFPEGWLVMNASRPLLGHANENGKFLDGIYYAGIDPQDSLASAYIEENRKLNASVIVTASVDEQMRMAIADSRYRKEYEQELNDIERKLLVTPLITRMQHTPYGQMKALLKRVQAEQGAQAIDAAPERSNGSAEHIENPVTVVSAVGAVSGPEGNSPSEPSTSSFSDDGEVPAFAIDRVWRGSTLQHMLDTQGHTPSTNAIFAALVSVESGEAHGDVSKRVLSSFRGWGVEGEKLRVDHRQSHANYAGNQIAQSLGMTPADFQRSYLDNRLESYYTPPQLCSAIWNGVMRAGVSAGGKFLDAGCGSAAFFASAPDKVQCHATLIGVECDPITARLASAVAPDARIINAKYEHAILARDFDAVIGNVPFGSSKIHDSNYPDAHHIHDYFNLRSLDQLKPGGISAVITSAGSLDKLDDTVRKEMLNRADLIGAVRLPCEAFMHLNASVATDILFLQRRPEGTKPAYDFTESVRVSLDESTGLMYPDEEGSESINRYFLDNPQNVLGKYEMVGTAFGPKPVLHNKQLQAQTIVDRFDALQVQIDARVTAFMPEGIAHKAAWEPTEQSISTNQKEYQDEDWSSFARIEQRQSNFVGDNIIVDDGRILEIVDIAHKFDEEGVLLGFEHVVAETKFSGKRAATMVAYIELRDACRELISAQLNGSDVVLGAAQEKTKGLYDAFTKKHGAVNTNKNVRIYGDDAGSAEVCALEIWDDEEEQVLALADTFDKRVIGAELVPNIETAEDAYFHSLDIKGRIDFEFMSEALGQDVDQIKQKLLGDLVFLNPQTHEYEAQHQYLSGNVVRKLADAEQALETMPELHVNVEKLREAQPSPIPFEDISLRLGVGWIPERDIEAFVSELFGQELSPRDFSVSHTAEVGLWTVEVSSSFKTNHETRRSTLHGTKDCSFEKLLEMQLNAQKPTHYDKSADGKSSVNDERTMASRTKQEDIESAFRTWVGRDVDRIHRYTEMYNANCNTIALPKIDGSRLTFPGLAATWHPRDHQRDAAAMALMGKNCMAAHCVGAGKTFEMVAIGIKLKQVGMCNKPAIAVPNHMLGQITREAKQMFPSARILQVTADDLKGAARQRFLARTRNNDWDLVVFTHGMMNRLQAPLEIQSRELLKNIDKISAKIEGTDGRIKRQLEAHLKTQVSKLDNVKRVFEDAQRKTGVLTIDKLGIDLINVDETHLFKNLAINSNMDVLGVTRGGSQRAENYKMLAEYMRDLHGRSFGINAFTGTPVANTICELYVHGSVLRPDLFIDQGIHDFDEWAKRFGDVVTALEPLPEGGGFRVNERFARFVNLPEMIKLFRSFADVKNPNDLNLPVPDVELIIISVDQSDFQKDFMKHLAIRATKVRTGKVKPHEDNMLAIATAGRKAALDMRLVSPLIPDDASLKLGEVAKNVHFEWEAHGDVNAAQIVFMDQGTPKADGSFTTYQKLRDLLVARGVPDNEIAFVHEAKNDVEKETLFEKVRKGEIRVIIGSTEKMGVGTNIQERLVAMHDVDCPWRPSDIAQRRGRIERQGNKFFENVRNYRYTTKDSFDLFMWGGNQRKANFIAQALGDPTKAGREVSEEIDLGYAEVMAVTTGNPKIREKVELDDQVNKAERRRRAWQSDLYTKSSEARRLSQAINNCGKRIASELIVAEALPKDTGGRKVVTVTGAVTKLGHDGSTTVLRATEAGEAILQRLPIAEARLMKFNKDYERLGISIGKIEYVVQNDLVTKQSFIRAVVDDALLPGRFGISKSPQSMGQIIREIYDTEFRSQNLLHEKKKLEASYELVKDFRLDAEWPQEAEFVDMKDRQRELNSWFAAQDFNSTDTTDPFEARMSILRAEEDRRVQLSELEQEIAANGDRDLADEPMGFERNHVADFDHSDSQEEGSRTSMRFG